MAEVRKHFPTAHTESAYLARTTDKLLVILG